MQKFKSKNINESHSKNNHRTVNYWLIILFLSSCFIFLLLGFLQAKGSFIDKTKWLAITLNPRLYFPSLIGVFILTFIGFPFCLPIRKVFKEYIWLLAPIIGFAYWSLWIYPSYMGLSFRFCLLGAVLLVFVMYGIAWITGAFKKISSPKCFTGLALIVLMTSIFHMYPYSQLGMTSYSGTGVNDSFYYACRSAAVVDKPLSERLPYLSENERGKLYLSRSAETVRLKSIMGTAFLQATATVFPGFNEVNAFPVVLVLAVLLTVIGTFLTARFGFGMSQDVAFVSAALIGVNPFFFFIGQSGFLRHLVGVIFLAPIFFMAVQGSLKKWLCFAYSALLLFALYSNYTVITPIGGMFLIGVPATVSFFYFIMLYSTLFKKIWGKNILSVRLTQSLITFILILVLAAGVAFAVKYATGILIDHIPLICTKYVSVTSQELFGLQPRPWMTKHKFSFLEHGGMAICFQWVTIIMFGLGIIRLLFLGKKTLIASALALFSIISLLAYSFHARGDTYSEFKYWSYVVPFVCVALATGLLWIAEKRQTFLSVFISLFCVLFLFDINVANLYETGIINVAQAQNYNTYVDDELKSLPELFNKIPQNKTIFLGPMRDWDTAWAMYYGRKRNVTISKRPSFYIWPRAKKGLLTLLTDWSYKITTNEIPGKSSIAQKGRFYLYER